MNSVQLVGRLTADPVVRRNGESVVANFSIAIDRRKKPDGTKETDFPRITVFGKQAENAEKYLVKGRLVGIEGRIQTGSYQNREGNTVYTTDVVANRVEFLEWGDKQNSGSGQNANPPQQTAAQQPPQQTAQAQPPQAQPPQAAPADPNVQTGQAPVQEAAPAPQQAPPANNWEEVDEDDW